MQLWPLDCLLWLGSGERGLPAGTLACSCCRHASALLPPFAELQPPPLSLRADYLAACDSAGPWPPSHAQLVRIQWDEEGWDPDRILLQDKTNTTRGRFRVVPVYSGEPRVFVSQLELCGLPAWCPKHSTRCAEATCG